MKLEAESGAGGSQEFIGGSDRSPKPLLFSLSGNCVHFEHRNVEVPNQIPILRRRAHGLVERSVRVGDG
jgi:hypothetical protein